MAKDLRKIYEAATDKEGAAAGRTFFSPVYNVRYVPFTGIGAWAQGSEGGWNHLAG